MKNVIWEIKRCEKCSSLAVMSLDGFWGCLKCRELPADSVNPTSERTCVFCGKPLILLMEACLDCGNQPRQGRFKI
jgi:hypothetical protein